MDSSKPPPLLFALFAGIKEERCKKQAFWGCKARFSVELIGCQ